jgi:hypothetical protein
MHRMTAGLGAAAVLVMSAALGAQSTATTASPSQRSPSDQHEANVTGCLAKSPDGRFTLTNARVEPADSTSTSTTAGTTGTTSTTTAGTSGTTTPKPTTTTEPAGSGTRRESSGTWWLSGGSDLEKHLGQRVQVTGRTLRDGSSAAAATSTTPSPSTTTADTKGPELEVQSIKMIASSCP